MASSQEHFIRLSIGNAGRERFCLLQGTQRKRHMPPYRTISHSSRFPVAKWRRRCIQHVFQTSTCINFCKVGSYVRCHLTSPLVREIIHATHIFVSARTWRRWFIQHVVLTVDWQCMLRAQQFAKQSESMLRCLLLHAGYLEWPINEWWRRCMQCLSLLATCISHLCQTSANIRRRYSLFRLLISSA